MKSAHALLLCCVLCSCSGLQQTGTRDKFGMHLKIETDLAPPSAPLKGVSEDSLVRDLMLERDLSFTLFNRKIELPKIYAMSRVYKPCINYGKHALIGTLHSAYMQHYPLVISPDMIWLLICQGFSNHVNNNAEKLRSKFVNFEGKKPIQIVVGGTCLDELDGEWSALLDNFPDSIAVYTGEKLLDVLKCDFSTSNQTSSTASTITIMKSMSSYFDYQIIMIGCGISSITLEGTTSDWQLLYRKTQYLRRYDLDWWVDRIQPLLSKFIEASKGYVDVGFWKNIYKYHEGTIYKRPAVIDGWILKFFPYTSSNERFNEDYINSFNALPPEILSVDLSYSAPFCNSDPSGVLKLKAGFTGATQDDNSWALKPLIGWFIHKESAKK